jgi:glycosyltransferase involved in cell wall biosynthesis
MGIQRESKHDKGYRFMRRYTDLVLAVSGQVRDFSIERDGLDPQKVFTLYNGVDLGRLDQSQGSKELRSSLGLQDASHLISTVGNLRPIKGTDVMIRAMAIVRRKFPRAVYVIAGLPHDRAYAQQLKELCQELGVTENIRFAGNQDNIGRFLKMTQIFCLPSRSEGFSNALIEAMACSLPCVATRVGGNAEALEEGVSGFLVESEDVEAMAARILGLLENPEKARQMGAAARRAVEERFTITAMTSKLVQLYEGLLQQKRNVKRS